MSRPYEYADEKLYQQSNLIEVVEGCRAAAQRTEDTQELGDLEHMARHALWEYKQRREAEIASTAGRIVVENG